MKNVQLKFLFLISLFFCVLGVNVSAQNLDIDVPLVKDVPPKLGSVLYQLTQSGNYIEFAETYNLYVEDDKVRVVIETTVEYTLSSEFGVEETKNGNLIQALVYIDKLLELADEPDIQFIRTPYKFDFYEGEAKVDVEDSFISNKEVGSEDAVSKTPPYLFYLVVIVGIFIISLTYFFFKRKKQ